MFCVLFLFEVCTCCLLKFRLDLYFLLCAYYAQHTCDSSLVGRMFFNLFHFIKFKVGTTNKNDIPKYAALFEKQPLKKQIALIKYAVSHFSC